MAQQYLFSYGTLQKEKVQLESFGRLLNGEKDALLGFRIDMLRITDEAVLATSQQAYHPIAIVSEDPSDRVEGMVFAVSDEELLAADKYEVDDYKRILVTLASGKEAWVYVQK
jgi:gamma-glutamylcyclotransferase (GGCT)/AIG2-like uncharacterized protein YtfP